MEYICRDCPRNCGVLRSDSACGGVCASPALPRIARAAPHFGEEPCISGTRGAGTIFFTGCNLRCVFCQNHEISRASVGATVSVDELRGIMLRLRDEGVHCIDLVTPTHYARAIEKALTGLQLGIPVVWNSSGYDSVETLKRMEGLIQVYMPDLKYMLKYPAGRYSAAPDYPEVATAAIREMFRQRGRYIMDDNGILLSGVLVRHLILPEQEENSMQVIDFIEREFNLGDILFSLMSQYTPISGMERFPELCGRVDERTNRALISYMRRCGITEGYWQETTAATDEMIPDFDGTGVLTST